MMKSRVIILRQKDSIKKKRKLFVLHLVKAVVIGLAFRELNLFKVDRGDLLIELIKNRVSFHAFFFQGDRIFYVPFCIALTCSTSNSKADATCSTLNPKANKRGTASNALFSLPS